MSATKHNFIRPDRRIYLFGGPKAWLTRPTGSYFYPHIALRYATGTILYVWDDWDAELLFSKDMDPLLRDWFGLSHMPSSMGVLDLCRNAVDTNHSIAVGFNNKIEQLTGISWWGDT